MKKDCINGVVEDNLATITEEKENLVIKLKKKMLLWNNPVEFVNNMYGSHPDDGRNDDDGPDYFKEVFKND